MFNFLVDLLILDYEVSLKQDWTRQRLQQNICKRNVEKNSAFEVPQQAYLPVFPWWWQCTASGSVPHVPHRRQVSAWWKLWSTKITDSRTAFASGLSAGCGLHMQAHCFCFGTVTEARELQNADSLLLKSHRPERQVVVAQRDSTAQRTLPERLPQQSCYLGSHEAAVWIGRKNAARSNNGQRGRLRQLLSNALFRHKRQTKQQ